MDKHKPCYWQLVQDHDDDENADLYIFGDIVAFPWESQGQQSGNSIVKALQNVTAKNITVHINSYGGDVSEGLAIYNTLKNAEKSGKTVTTMCDGFACSAASVVFMAGSRRVMNAASLLMIHNAWTVAMGNASELEKAADDLRTITQASVEAYKTVATISEKEIKKLMDAETWILPADAVEYGFATEVADAPEDEDGKKQQSAFRVIMNKLTAPAAETQMSAIDAKDLAEKVAEILMTVYGKPGEVLTPTKSGWESFFGM